MSIRKCPEKVRPIGGTYDIHKGKTVETKFVTFTPPNHLAHSSHLSIAAIRRETLLHIARQLGADKVTPAKKSLHYEIYFLLNE